MWKMIFGLVIGFCGIVSLCVAGDTLNFGESQTAVGSGDVEDFQIYDLDGDGKADIVYKNTSGNVKYSLQGSEENVIIELSLELDQWEKMTTGNWEKTDEGITVYGSGYRKHGMACTKTEYDFLNSETFYKWRPGLFQKI